MKKIVFRVDGNATIGAGHIMRCLSIANAAKEKNIDCIFITSDSSFEQSIVKTGFKNIILNSNYLNISSDFVSFGYFLNKEMPDLVIVDSYFANNDLFDFLKKNFKVLFVDDLNLFDQNVDYLLNYNEYAFDLGYTSKFSQKKYLLGASFVPLRQEFQNLDEIKTKSEVKSVFFSAGGADPERICLSFVKKIISLGIFNDLVFHLILGKFEPDKELIREICKNHKGFILHENINNMSQVIRECDLAISAAGSTLYEICACGVPCITFITEENQVLGAKAFSKKGIMLCAGDYRTDKNLYDSIASQISELVNSFFKRKEMHDKALKLVDGKGAERIIDFVVAN